MRKLVIGAFAILAWAALAAPAMACSVEGWTVRQAATNAIAIVEADVVRADAAAGGYELAIRQVVKGAVPGDTLVVGRTPVAAGGGECGGQVALAQSDHVILALSRLDNVFALETAVWWIEPDGTIRRTSLVPNDAPTTRAAVLRALRLSAPDTATSPLEAPVERGLPLPWFAGVAGGLLVLRRLRDRSKHESSALDVAWS